MACTAMACEVTAGAGAVRARGEALHGDVRADGASDSDPDAHAIGLSVGAAAAPPIAAAAAAAAPPPPLPP